MTTLENQLKVNSRGELRTEQGRKLQTNIQRAAYDLVGNLKPGVYFIGDSISWFLHHIEGIEGLHKKVSEYLVTNDPKHKPRLIYLNRGFFRIKPDFHMLTWTGTTEPQAKKMNGFYSGFYEVYDVQNKIEGLLWCYSKRDSFTNWESLRDQIDFTIAKMQNNGLATPDKFGYLPVVLKIGKLPEKLGLKFAKPVGWDFTNVSIQEADFISLTSPMTKNIYLNNPPLLPNEFEDKAGIKLFRRQS